MAGDGEIGNDMKAHEKSYSLFSMIMKWGAVITFILAMIIVLILGS